MTKRDYFPMEEYKSLVSVIEEMATEGVEVRGVPVTLEFKYLVQFMVNSFIRPSDLRVLRRPHVKVQVAWTAASTFATVVTSWLSSPIGAAPAPS